MRIAIITALNPAYRSIGEVTLPVMHTYATKHDYSLLVGEYKEDPHDLVSYGDRGKIALYLKHYDEYDAIMWLDVDVLITNHDVSVGNVLEDRDFLWTYSADGPCSGFWIARCVPNVAIMFNKVRHDAVLGRGTIVKQSWNPHAVTLQVEPNGTSDQMVMRDLMGLPPYSAVLGGVNCVSCKQAGHCFDNRVLTWPESYDALSNWTPGDWLYTLPSIEIGRRRDLLEQKAVELGLALEPAADLD